MCMFVSACSSGGEIVGGTYAFNKEKYPPITEVHSDVVYDAENIEQAEYMMMEILDGKVNGLIAKCSVVGKSVNWIIPSPWEEREPGVKGSSHVLTPVRIDEILYAGSAVDVNEGESFLLIEPFFYVTDETPFYQELYGDKQVSAHLGDYNPVINGKQYIMLLRYVDDYQDTPGQYPAEEGTVFFQPAGRRFTIYEIGEKTDAEENLVTIPDGFWNSWEQVMEIYGDYKGALPFSEPQVYAQNKDAKD